MFLRITFVFTLLVIIGLSASGQDAGQGTTLIKLDGGILWAHNIAGIH